MRLIQDILKGWKEESGSNRVVQYQYRSGVLTIYTSQPGWFIGVGGKFEETAWYWI